MLTCSYFFLIVAGAKAVTSPTSNTAQDAASDFSVGQRIWVNGNKPGYVQFIGGTQFAPGQWAGIVLDEPIGKNDGSVAGVRYFQCEDLRGIFTRPSKLSRTPVPEREANGTQTPANKTSTSPAKDPVPVTQTTSATTKTSTNLTRAASESASNLSETDSAKKLQRELKLGDRVLVRPVSGLSSCLVAHWGKFEGTFCLHSSGWWNQGRCCAFSGRNWLCERWLVRCWVGWASWQEWWGSGWCKVRPQFARIT